MSSMFKKKGGMAFKPKMPLARPRAPGAASPQLPSKVPSSSTATGSADQAISEETAAQEVVNSTAEATEPTGVPTTDTPPSTSPNAIEAPTTQSRRSIDNSKPNVVTKATEEVTTSKSAQADEASVSQTHTTQAPTAPTMNTPQSTSSAYAPDDSQSQNTTAPIQLQTPPATAPSGTNTASSVESQVGNASEPAPSANDTAKAPAIRGRKRATQAPVEETEDGDGSTTAPKPKRPRKRKDATTVVQSIEGDSEALKRQTRPRKQKSTVADSGAIDGAEHSTTPATAKPKRTVSRRPRSVTPEGAENQEADLSVLTMGDLTRDLRIGKKFSRHDELLQRYRDKQAKYRERLKNRRNGSEDVGSDGGTPVPGGGGQDGTPVPTPAPKSKPHPAPMISTGPQFQIIDGQIVVDQNSLSLDRHAIAAAAEGQDMLEIEENDFTTLTTQNSYRTGSKLKGPNVWTEEETELFYRGLRMFGTDFQMISGMFPGKNRRHVKMKFNREERHSPARIDAILVGKKELQIDLEEYKTWTKAEYEPVEAIMAAQRAQQAEFDAEQAKVKAAKDAINARKKAALEDDGDGGDEPPNGESSTAGGGGGGGKSKSGKSATKQQASAGPQITVDADGMITIDETNMDMDAGGGKRKRGSGKAKKKAVEYNMRGEVIG